MTTKTPSIEAAIDAIHAKIRRSGWAGLSAKSQRKLQAIIWHGPHELDGWNKIREQQPSNLNQ